MTQADYNFLRTREHKPRFHGVGFVQLYLTKNLRLNVWHPDLPPTVKNAVFHDHKFDLFSVEQNSNDGKASTTINGMKHQGQRIKVTDDGVWVDGERKDV